jgi:hypothetical protein
MKYILVLISLFFNFNIFASELYGVGKVIEAHDEKIFNELGFKYFLLVKDKDQVGAFPIKIKDKAELAKIKKLKDQMVVFKGKTEQTKMPLYEKFQMVETMTFAEVNALSFANLRPSKDKLIQPAEKSFVLTQTPKYAEITLNQEATATTLATSAAFLLNEAAAAGDSTLNRDITRGVILTAGVTLLAVQLKKALKLDFSDWKITK